MTTTEREPGLEGMPAEVTDEVPHTARRVGRGVGISTLSNIALRVGNFGVSVIMAHLIAPADFGAFAVALTIWTVLQTLAELGLGSDLVRCQDLERRVPTVTTVGLMISSTLGLSMLLGSGPIARAFDSPAATPAIQLMAVSMFLFGLTIVPSARLVRDLRQGSMFVVNGLALIASTGTMVAVASAGHGVIALAVGQIASQLVSVVGLHLAAGKPVRVGFDREIARDSLGFSLPIAGANLLSWLVITVDNLIVSRVLSPAELGFYVLAFNISSWPMSALGASIRVVALPVMSRMAGAEDRARALLKVSGPIWAAALGVGMALALLALPVVQIVYGARWSPAGAALAGLAAFGVLRVMFDLMTTYLVTTGSTRSVFAVQVIWLAAMIPTMIFAVGRFGLQGAGWTHLVVAVAVVLPAYLFCLRRLGVPIWGLIRTWLVPSAFAVPAAVLTWFIIHPLTSPWLALVSGAAIIGVLYGLPIVPWCVKHLRIARASSPSSTPSSDIDAASSRDAADPKGIHS